MNQPLVDDFSGTLWTILKDEDAGEWEVIATEEDGTFHHTLCTCRNVEAAQAIVDALVYEEMYCR